MVEFLNGNDKRTCYCGEISEAHLGKNVCVTGWVQKQRDLGSLIFIDLRDRTGIVQLAFDNETKKEIADKAFSCRSEYVLCAHGTVRRRAEGAVNPNLKTGTVEIFVTELKILSEAMTPPFEIADKVKVREDTALKYRYLDLRRPKLQKNIKMRHDIAKIAREYFYENGFYEIETPMMIKPTPEGARDYIIPSRLHKGSFYALPQSPQIYKQLLMVAGFDRYIQLARCFRDEDSRADRQPEFTQIDMEMSFATQEDIMAMNEGFIKRLFAEVLGENVETPVRRMKYAEALEKYGTDKPDLRYGMEIKDISDIVKNCGFGVFADAVRNRGSVGSVGSGGGSVRAIVARDASSILTRKEIDRLSEHAKGIGAKGLAFIRNADGVSSCSFAKFMTPEEMRSIYEAVEFGPNDVMLICAGKNKTVLQTLGAIRTIVARKLDMIPKGLFRFVWITEFPFFEWNEETSRWEAMHHPFTMPLEECLGSLESDPGSVRAESYDLVLNGTELLSGSMRITDWRLQEKMFKSLGLDKEEAEKKFGFLIEAYKYGAPPHGGSAMGLDRLAMVMSEAESLKDVIAFPKVQNASDLMSGSPAPGDPSALRELGIRISEEND